MFFEYKDIHGNQKTIDLPIELSDFDTIKHRVEGIALEDLEYWEFWDIRDDLYKTLIIENFRDHIIEFFTKIHLQQFEFKDDKKRLDVNVVDVYYHFNYGDRIYLFVEPSWEFYSEEMFKNRLEIHLKYDIEELEHLLEQILDAFGVNYEEWKEEGETLSEDELEIGDMFCDVLFDCWSITKNKTSSSVIGMLSYATGGGGYTDLDTQQDVEQTDEGIRKHIEERNQEN